MATLELIKKAKELKELKRMAEEIQEEITALEDTIKAEMNSRNTDSLIIGEYKIKYLTVQNKRFDTTALKSAHSDRYNEYT
jgi:predicted phage-related endonuclease